MLDFGYVMETFLMDVEGSKKLENIDVVMPIESHLKLMNMEKFFFEEALFHEHQAHKLIENLDLKIEDFE